MAEREAARLASRARRGLAGEGRWAASDMAAA
jgi:hypothetical protein